VKILLGVLGLAVPQVTQWWNLLIKPLGIAIPLWVPMWALIAWGTARFCWRAIARWREADSAIPTGVYRDTSRWENPDNVDTGGMVWKVMTPGPVRCIVGRKTFESPLPSREVIAAATVEGPFCPKCEGSMRRRSIVPPLRLFTCSVCGKRRLRFQGLAHMRMVAMDRAQHLLESRYTDQD
jgi:hypothetical protein